MPAKLFRLPPVARLSRRNSKLRPPFELRLVHRRNPYTALRKYPANEGSAAERDGRTVGVILALFLMCSILLVEDHYDTQRAFAAILRSWGHDVATSDSAASGLNFLNDNEVDVILSDIGLPDQNGYDFIAQVRRQNSRVTAIAVSAYFTAEDQQRGHDAGFDMHFAKPVDLHSLRLALTRLTSPLVHNGNGAGKKQGLRELSRRG